MGLGWLRAVAQGYSCTYIKIELGNFVSKSFKELGSKIGLLLVWPRVVAHGYSYSINIIELKSNFQKNLKSWGVTWGASLDVCARWRKVTSTFATTLNGNVIFKII